MFGGGEDRFVEPEGGEEAGDGFLAVGGHVGGDEG